MNLLWENTKTDLKQAKILADRARELCCVAGGPYLYEDALTDDLLMIRDLEEKTKKKDYDGIAEILNAGKPSFSRLSDWRSRRSMLRMRVTKARTSSAFS